MKRVMIFGFSGAGKSTLARRIAEKIGTEPTHLDALHWLPGWVESGREYKRNALRPVLEREKWVIDGNYMKVLFDERLDTADTVVFLDFNRFICLFRVIKRYLNYRGRSRPDMGEGCPEKLDAEFLRWVLLDGRKNRGKYRSAIREAAASGKRAETLKNPREVRDFLNNL